MEGLNKDSETFFSGNEKFTRKTMNILRNYSKNNQAVPFRHPASHGEETPR